MRKYLIVALGFLVAPASGATPAKPAWPVLNTHKTATFCRQMNVVAESAAGLQQYSNTQIENGVCMLSKINAQLIGQSAPQETQDVCMESMQSVFLEFKRRWPNRDAKETVGRC
jgi:hypothetical protein